MTVWITALAALVAVGAAARSTWSPCGLSMLSTITPVAERGKGHRYRATAAWFVLGAAAGGATLGLLLAGLAAAVGHLSTDPSVLGVAALGAALVGAASDAGVAGVRLPIHRRQVNERWLDQYRPWVYAAGFGWQIGTGVATYVTSAAVYLMLALAVLTGRPFAALAIGTGFGLCRGLAVLLTRRLVTPSQLRAFHRRFSERGPAVGRMVTGLEVLVAVALLASLHSGLALLLTSVALVALLAVVEVRRMKARAAPSVGLGEGGPAAGDRWRGDVGDARRNRRHSGDGPGAGLEVALAPPPPLQRAEPARQ